MKCAIVYDRVNKWGGAERVLLALHEIFPEAPLYTSVYEKDSAAWADVFPEIKTSFLQKIPLARRNHEYFFPLMPFAFESFDFSQFDLVISVTSESAKGIITKPGTKHICICLTPTRYLWSGHLEYMKGTINRFLAAPLVHYLRQWDSQASRRPDKLIAISNEVKKRIYRYYGMDAEIVFPPVHIPRVKVKQNTSDYYLVVSRLVGYKRVDLAIQSCEELGKNLIVVGEGRQKRQLQNLAGKHTTFVSKLTDEELATYYMSAKALIFPQVEDFGLVSVESQLYGTPVIAYNKGGALDTVIGGVTGLFFTNQTVNSLKKAIQRFEKTEFDRKTVMKYATRFDTKSFQDRVQKIIQ